MSELQSRLQGAIGEAYRVERELGGGGMSRVFLALESALGRRVVIKVLPPDMAAGVNAERFRREIQLSASLQHPHVVSLLTAGAAGDLLWYVMPYIEGESLRAKLAREGELPVGDTVRILRDVTDALAYAHAQGVVHRDIKPDNVLLSGKHALVADFGVARAVSASSGASTVTSLGVALGTPAYMAPEQAAADPHVDHRADVYAVGALAYEMLTGRTPFSAPTPQAMLAAQVTESVAPVAKYRTAVPQPLADIVMRCLEKKPADRWQSADEVQAQLEAIATPSGGITPTGSSPYPAVAAASAGRHGHPLRVITWYSLASLAVLAIAVLLMRTVGVPDWVFPVVIALLLAGLPIMVVTGLVERRRAVARVTGAQTSVRPGLQGWLTWRKALTGGGIAFGTLVLATVVFMVMRVLGIGPLGTLVASGVLKDQEALILTNFENRAMDTTLGPSLTEAFRVDLSQSRTVRLLDPSAITDALRRMERPTTPALDLALARDIAQREGVKAIVTGQIDPVGRSYVLSASLVSASDGHVLTSVRENAPDDAALIGAIDKLSRKLRERIGESLLAIRANEPLERVTTGSLEALRKYSQALIAIDRDGDDERGIVLLREATSLDTGFAMAYRKLWAELSNTGAPFTEVSTATRHAYANRDRLPDLERHLVDANYYWDLDYDPPRIISAYRSALDLDPNNTTALNNLALIYNGYHQWAQAESLAVRATQVEMGSPQYNNGIQARVALGNWDGARALNEQLARSPGQLAMVRWNRVRMAGAERDYPAAAAELDRLAHEQSAAVVWENRITDARAALAEVQGRLGEATNAHRQAMSRADRRSVAADYIQVAIRLAWLDVRYRNRPDAALQVVATALAKHPWNSLDPLDRPYAALAELYAAAGRADQAKELLREYVTLVPEGIRREDPTVRSARGAIALAEGRLEDAALEYRNRLDQDTRGCVACGWYELAGVLDRMGQSDSALALLEAILSTPSLGRMFGDAYRLAPTYKRLGELSEARGDRAKARDYYGRFVALWRDADPELQPVVRDVRARIGRLTTER